MTQRRRAAATASPRESRRSIVSRLDVAQHAGNKAPADVRSVAGDLGFVPVDLAPFSRSSRRDRVANIARAGLQAVSSAPRLGRSQVLLVQHPLGRVNDRVLARLARRLPSILLVHDLESLRQVEYALREQQTLASYDVVVVHTPAMAAHLRERLPATRTVVLGCFDYLLADPPPLPDLSARPEALYVIGRLGPDKAGYLYGLGQVALPVRAYGHGCDVARLPPGARWEGVLDMQRPRLDARDGFGVVWDGTSPDRLEGQTGTYLRYNSPHKFSMYLALGLPVVVPTGSALAELVVREGVGLVADTVAQASQEAAACSAERWQELADAVAALRERVVTGGQTRTALEQALGLLGLPRP